MNTKHNKCTVTGVTLLGGIEIFAEPIGNSNDQYFFENNTGKGQIFLTTRPEYTYKSKTNTTSYNMLKER